MGTVEKNPDEIWTSYLIRRLRGIDKNVSDFREDDELSFVAEMQITHNTKLELFKSLMGAEFPLDSLSTYSLDLSDILTDVVAIDVDRGECYLGFQFNKDGTAECDEHTGIVLEKYKRGEVYRAEDVIDDIIQYVEDNFQETYDREEEQIFELEKRSASVDVSQVPIERRGEEIVSKDSERISEILRTVKKLEGIVAEHPIVLREEGTYLSELYTRAINEDVNNLKIFEYGGERIPYVLVHSFDLEGKPGKPFRNLFFVARDLSPEDWQQKIVAYHESLCLRIGHDDVRAKEPEVARFLGKEKEYSIWREKIDNSKV